jgi:hypothetical protein
MPMIISLCDSDDEVPANSSRIASRPKKVSIESTSEVIDLLEDSDDEMELRNAVALSRAEAVSANWNPATITQEAYPEAGTRQKPLSRALDGSQKVSARHGVINDNKTAAMLAASSNYDSDDSSILQVEAPSSKPKSPTKPKAKTRLRSCFLMIPQIQTMIQY